MVHSRKEYWVVFAVLAALTVLELGVAKAPGLGKGLMVSGLIALALAKAACVGLFYMHLRYETRVLKLTVAIPLMMPMVYALVLIGDAAWRHLA